MAVFWSLGSFGGAHLFSSMAVRAVLQLSVFGKGSCNFLGGSHKADISSCSAVLTAGGWGQTGRGLTSRGIKMFNI